MDELADRVFSIAAEQIKATDARLGETELPRTTGKDGEAVNSDYRWWCSGFFPGSAWYAYEYTGDANLKDIALKNTLKLAGIPDNVDSHDIGFMIWCSYGNALRLTGDTSLLETIHASADKLCTRYRPGAGIIQSWNARLGKDWICPVIIDNMMNLELLMECSKLFEEPCYAEISVSHADVTMGNHFRKDNSSYHVLDYNPENGEIRHRHTEQGLADESAWARGQAWGLYGYTMMYRECGKDEYLAQAEKIADYIIPRLPEDGVCFWDFNVPEIRLGQYEMVKRDASAAAIVASALTELASYVEDAIKSEGYLAVAEKIVRTLASDEYLAKAGENNGFILKHGVGHYRNDSEVDVPLTYADYYFLEAVIRLKESME
ncbi:MAG: glycoside hydrolase family 88 protein [Bacteroidales bacterium]|nr:glycoside hydrolase family 88 protein [Bacteroidales bacterium]